MDEYTWLAQRFEAERPHLRAVAYRLLGRLDEVDDAVQESWLRLSSSDPSSIANLGAWLMTVVARVCLDMLRARHARREESLEASVPQAVTGGERAIDPEQEMELADSVGLALLVVLDTLAPAERLAFVLHDIFAVPFDEIAPIVEREVAAARQLASRARRRVRARAPMQDADLAASREVVEAFLTAAREGNFDALLAVLDPDVVLRRYQMSVPAGVPGEIHGAAAVAKQFVGRAQATQPALVNGSVGVVVAPYGRLLSVLDLSTRGGKITAITAISDPARLRQLHLAVLDD
ncbi:sigma-70 family RNA polymerase sigma factor [Ktedonobacter racemifer]|uniref:RNA polymerase, sigma-24 subunit, ECF subfamily n=1 Tax=Ktedonobacter racemifer DSM 44963 TaxID=485913 RepID=D6TRZ8_KTERA|nr:sigma-70 family RNA polymerase sigma factor [Ktedonobacter racemifer]EFH86071.1 RNA polymerase, sigma-24 subunit, ECF subfamily [Ktedonobacter racemifer DSM 44963]